MAQAIQTPHQEGKPWLSFLFFVSLLICTSAWSSTLADTPAWRALLHFPKHATRSLIEDSTFFISPQGRTDPYAELIASVQAFSQPPSISGDASPQCRWIGRYRWLQRHAPDLAKNFVPQDCPAWQELISRVNPHSATLVFPDGYLNSPASMFGHTLLRIDQTPAQPLRSFAVNYAAQTQEDNGIIYAFNGLSGRYKGYYSFMPYPEKLQEYQFSEQRDIWEYALKLTPEETETIVAHIWDLQNIYTPYYFLDRNCSYQLLALIEVAKPELDLLNGWGVSVMPIDTIRRLQGANLLGASHLRPSQATQINHKLAQLSDAEIALIQQLGDPESSLDHIDWPRDNTRLVRVLDTATEYLQWQRSRQNISLEQYRSRFLFLLSQRSRHRNIPTDSAPPTSANKHDPLEGHGTHKLSTALIQQGVRHELGLSFRPAFHDIRERAQGYRPGAGISFLEVQARWSHEYNTLKVDALDLLKIESLAPRNALLKPYSWRINLGAKRTDPLDPNRPLHPFLAAGAGPTYSFDHGRWLTFASAQAQVAQDRTTRQTMSDLGWQLGAQWRPNPQHSLTLTTHDWLTSSTMSQTDHILQIDWAYYPSKDQSLQLQRKASLGKSDKTPMHTLAWSWFY